MSDVLELEPKIARFADFALQEAKTYLPDHMAAEVLSRTGAFTVSSIVAGGKSTVSEILLDRDYCALSISHTTRDPENRDRINPDDPESYPTAYHYVDMEHMVGKMLAREMLEVAPVHGNIYGTSLGALGDVAAVKKRPLLDIDVQGVQKLQSTGAVFPSFFLVPTVGYNDHVLEPWLKRWSGRDPEIDRETFDKRVASAQNETQAALDMSDARSMYLVINDKAENAAQSIVDALEAGQMPRHEDADLTLVRFIRGLNTEVHADTLWDHFQAIRADNA